MDRWERDGVWTENPWFLEAEDDLFVSMGFPLHARRESAATLAKLFTPDVCRSIRDDPEGGYGIALLLFHRYWPGMLIPLLEVGRDLGVVAPWSDVRFLKRFTKRDEFHEAALELRVLANLRRAAYPSERVSEHPSSKTPDIRVQIGIEWHDVEIKAVHPSPIDDAGEELHRRLSAGDMLVPGLNLTLVGSNNFASRAGTALDSVMREADAIVGAFADAASRVRTAAVPGEYEAPPYGLIRAVPGPRFGSVTPAVMPELSQERRVVKAMRLVRRAAEQLTTRRGIAITGVWHAANLLDLAEAVRSEARRQPNAFRCCHMVVLIDSVTDESTGRRSIPIALPVQVHERRALTKAQLRFASAAAGDGGHQARFVRAAKAGEPGVTLRTTRRPVTSVSLGSAAMPIGGGTMKFHFDGRPPEVSPLEDEHPGGETP